MRDSGPSPRTRLTVERQVEIAELAEGVVEAHCGADVIDPDAIIRRKGIALFYDHYEDAFDGMLEYEDGRFFVHCNLDRENTPGTSRARFTLAHELGHYFIDEHRNNLVSGQVGPHPSCSDRISVDLLVEREADFFASRLLMPDSRFLPATKRLAVGLSGVKAIAQRFDVSLTCASIRCVAAEAFPCAVIKWSQQGVCWKWCSPSFWAYGYRKTIPSLERLPRDSATAKVCATKSQPGEIIEGTLTAAYIFPAVHERSFQNIILREEAISLGKYGALTMLSLRSAFPKEVVALRARELSGDD